MNTATHSELFLILTQYAIFICCIEDYFMENISINDWLPYSEKSTLSHFVNRLLYLCLPDIYFELHLLKYIALEEYYSNYICLKRTLTHSMIVVQFTTGKLYYYYEKRQKSQAAFI